MMAGPRLRVPSLYTIGSTAILVAIFLRGLTGPIDSDLWWQLANGRYILETRSIPSSDWMSLTAFGRPWVDQWWLAQLITWTLYRLGGMWAVYLLYAGATAMAFVFVHLRMRRRHVPETLGVFLLVAGALAAALSWGPRVQMLSLCLFSAYFWLLGRFAATGSRYALVPLPLLMVVWVNLHGAFVMGVALLAIEAVAAVLDRRLDRARSLAGAMLVTGAATLLNPAFARVWEFPLRTLTPDLFHRVIAEAASPDFHHRAVIPFEMLLLLLLAAFLASPDFRWRDLLLALALTHLALSQIRHLQLWAVGLTPLIGSHLAAAWQARHGGSIFTQDLSPGARARLNAAVGLFVVLAYAAVFGRRVAGADFAREEARDFPAVAASQLEREEGHRILTTFEWAGYLVWRLGTGTRVFIDGRANSVYDESIMREYLAVMDGHESWPRLLIERQVDTLVLPTSSPLASEAGASADWRCMAAGKSVVVCRRQAGAANIRPYI